MILDIKKNITKVHKAEIPVIAVGSAIIGGSGKTPSVLFLCEELEKMGYNPHIISRGYGGTSNEIIKVKLSNDVKVNDDGWIEFAYQVNENGVENITKFPFGPEHNIVKN